MATTTIKAEKQFTVSCGMKLQKQSLQMWEKVLNTETFEYLKSTVEKHNKENENITLTGFDVLRGQDLDSIVTNRMYKLYYSNLETNKS